MRAILLDIEGTTTPIAFVYDILFPYVRRYLESPENEIDAGDIEMLRSEFDDDIRQGNNPPDWNPAGYCLWLMDRDRKSTALKSIQGKIWQEGYQKGELKGQVFPDVPVAFQAWRDQSIAIYIFSSGSVLAQKLLFGHSDAGNLMPYLSGYFDTNVGSKTSPESYRVIAAAIGVSPDDVTFVSDVTAELDAATAGGMRTVLCSRPGNRPQPDHSYPVVDTLQNSLPIFR